MDRLGQPGQKGLGRLVLDLIHGIQTQGVNMVVGDPVEGVFDKETPHFFAPGAVKVEGLAPRGVAPRVEIGAEIPQVVALGAQMVVDHVQDHRQAL